MGEDNIYEILYMSRMGDPYALRALFLECRQVAAVHTVSILQSRRYLHSYQDDLMQEGLVCFPHALDAYREDRGANFRTFFSLIAKRRMAGAMREFGRQNGADVCEVYSMDWEQDSCRFEYRVSENMAYPEYSLRYRMASERLLNTYNAMSEEEKKTVKTWMEGYSYKEAAGKLGISVKTYDGRLQKVKKLVHCAVYGTEKKRIG